jgi:hypothetical protein
MDMKRCLIPLALLAALLAPAGAWADVCFPTATRLCLSNYRFTAEVAWTAPGFGSGTGKAVPLTGDTGTFWFFDNSNTELVVKVLDGRALNRHFWVFYGGLSDVEYTLTVTDTLTGVQEVYHNPAGRLASASDVTAFDEESPDAAGAAAVRAAAPPPPPPAPLRLGSELQVNVTTWDNQASPAVAVAPDGGFAVAWLGTPGLWVRFFDPAGRPRGGELRLDTVAALPEQPRVAADAAGRFLVVWSDTGNAVRGRAFDAAGQPAGGEILVAGGPTGVVAPDVAGAPGGGFLAIWQELASAFNGPSRIHTQRFDGQGGRTGGENQFSTVGRASFTRMAVLPPDGFLVSWSLAAPSGPIVSDVLAQRLDASGQAVGGPVQVSVQAPGLVQGVAPVGHPDGGFSVVWANGMLGQPEMTGLFGRRFGPDGSPAGGAVRLRQGGSILDSFPEAVGLPSGDTWVLWYEQGLPQDLDGGIFSGVFDASWNSRGIQRVNTYTAAYQMQPVAAAGPGGAVAAWSSGLGHLPILEPTGWGSGTQDGSYFGVFAQRFTTATCAPEPTQLCLNGRFRVEVRFTDPRSGQTGDGQGIPLTSDTGAFWFFDAANLELVIKVLDGRGVNGRFWVYAGALSDVAYTITVTDTATGKVKTYRNAAHQLASRSDTSAF